MPTVWPYRPRVTLWHPETGRKQRLLLRPGMRIVECGDCERRWDDARVTSVTPSPSGRCPFEATHGSKWTLTKLRRIRARKALDGGA